MVFIPFFFVISLISPAYSYAQVAEICNNAIDDDGDGLIDLNDNDCNCPIDLPTSLIPNPSFEDQSDCPTGERQLELAIPWQQASPGASADYMHTCGILEHPVVSGRVPLPMPDGDGCVGFRNGKPGNQANIKEYTGACLTEPLEEGTLYTLNMWVGFLNSNTSPEFELTIFGAGDCVGNLPFGGNNTQIGCPLNAGGYEQLGSSFVSGQNEWVNTSITFRPSRDLNVVVIGPNCDPNPFNHYYFFDNLILQKTVEFGEQPSVSGHPCMNNVSLDLVDQNAGETYQWYKDGVAILGEVNADYIIPTSQNDMASYQILVDDGQGVCKISAPYTFEIPEITTSRTVEICDNEPIQLNDQDIVQSGTYSELFTTALNCDSTVITNLIVHPTYDIFLEETICEREVYILGTQILNLEGVYTEFFTSVEGCDSVVTVELEVLESFISVDAQGDKSIRLGEITPIRGVISDPNNAASYMWTSSNISSPICDTCLFQLVQPTETTSYIFSSFDFSGCEIVDSVVIEVLAFYEVFYPTAFSPNGDGVNDFYLPMGTANVSSILHLDIFDRWGNKVYERQNLPLGDEQFGWDGSFRNSPANPGVYVYSSQVEFIDGHIEHFKGDLVLLR